MIASNALRTLAAMIFSGVMLTSCTTARTQPAARPRSGRPVIFIPGLAATRLYDPVTQRYVWGTAHSTMQTRYADNLELRIDENHDIQPDRLIPRGQVGPHSPFDIARQFTHALEADGYTIRARGDHQPPDIYVFDYDWRLSYTTNARRLDSYIETIRARHGDPDLQVDLIGYSAGGIVAVTFLKLGIAPLEDPSSWENGSRAAAAKIGRAILVAAPLNGVIDPVRVVHRGERFVMRTFHPEIVALYPSLLELLPEDGSFLIDESGQMVEADLWNPQTWRELGLGIFDPHRRPEIERRITRPVLEDIEIAFERSLARASIFRQMLARPFPADVEVRTIGSNCVPTAERALLRKDGSLAFDSEELRPGEFHLASSLFSPGDGSVTSKSAAGSWGEPMDPVCSEHQAYGRNPEVHRAIAAHLNGGTTQAQMGGGSR